MEPTEIHATLLSGATSEDLPNTIYATANIRIEARGIHHQSLVSAIEAIPAMLEALEGLRDGVDAGEFVITFTGVTNGKPSTMNRAGVVGNIDSARYAIHKARG